MAVPGHEPLPGADSETARRWSQLHHGIDPASVPLLGAWLRLMWWLARPLARLRVRPIVLTVLGVAFAVGAALSASTRPWLAAALVLASVLCDGLDGAVAVLAGRGTALGARADKIADRLADCAFAAVLWGCGAPWWLAAVAGGISLAHEGIREYRGGMLRTMITVAERPTRTICALLAGGCAGVSSAGWPPTVCAGVWIATGLVGLGQLLR